MDHPHQSLVLFQHGQSPVCVRQVSGHSAPEHPDDEREQFRLRDVSPACADQHPSGANQVDGLLPGHSVERDVEQRAARARSQVCLETFLQLVGDWLVLGGEGDYIGGVAEVVVEIHELADMVRGAAQLGVPLLRLGEHGPSEPEQIGLVGDEPPPQFLCAAIGEPQDEVRDVVNPPVRKIHLLLHLRMSGIKIKRIEEQSRTGYSSYWKRDISIFLTFSVPC